MENNIVQTARSRHTHNRSEMALCLRFVAAVIARCSGDKSDKEESAGRFRCYVDCALQMHPLLAGRARFIALMITGAAAFTACFCRLAAFFASIGLFC
jgi:hypothetical protein